jgi:transposase-like protein
VVKLPERERERIRQAYWEALDEATDERDGKERLQALVDQLNKAGYTAAARSLAEDLDALVVHLRYPTRHRRRWRSTNLLERSLGEVKRRTKVIGRFPGETSTLVQGALRQGDQRCSRFRTVIPSLWAAAPAFSTGEPAFGTVPIWRPRSITSNTDRSRQTRSSRYS